jgi:predicted MPP superfamily phosphohydrolase
LSHQIDMRIGRFSAALIFTVAATTGCAQPQQGPVQVSAPQTPQQAVQTPPTPLPNRADSLKFAVLGDFGDGSDEQYQTAAEMARVHQRFPYELVITVGDNIYGSERPQDFVRKFETPYKPLLDAGVKFYASLGNHDSREQRFYKLFNMDGKLYYSFKPDKQSVRFIALESAYLEPEQVQWLEKELEGVGEDWKILYFHHPPYSSGNRHGSHVQEREVLEPLFVKYNVSVVFTGHDHIYERVQPQQGIAYFVVGSGGKLRRGGIDRRTGITAVAFATDRAFLVGEINGDEFFFNAISRTGQVIDSGVITRRK